MREVRKSWLCKFDWYMKTRVAAELGKRVEYLTQLIEKDLADAEASAKREEEKKGGKKAGSKRPAETDHSGGGGKRRRE